MRWQRRIGRRGSLAPGGKRPDHGGRGGDSERESVPNSHCVLPRIGGFLCCAWDPDQLVTAAGTGGTRGLSANPG